MVYILAQLLLHEASVLVCSVWERMLATLLSVLTDAPPPPVFLLVPAFPRV